MEKKQVVKPALWNRNFIQCCLSYFLMNFAFYMTMPTLPVYLVEELGIDNSEVGMALSSYSIGVLCVRPFSGYLVDCFSRKPLYLFAFTFFGFFFLGYFFIPLWLLMIVRFLQGGFMGLTSVSGNTIAIDVIPSERRGEGMGFYGLTINLAMSLSPLVAVWAYAAKGFSFIICISLLISVLGILSVMMIKYPPRKPQKRPSFSLDRFILLAGIPTAVSYIFIAIPYGMILSFVVLYGREIGIANPGYFFIFMAIGVGISRLISGRLVDKGYIHQVAISSIVCLVIVFALFSTVHVEPVFYGAALLMGVGFGTGVPAFQCLSVNVAPHCLRGTATSTYLTSFDVGIGVGTLIAGFISVRYGLAAAYLLGSFSCLVSLIIYLKWTKGAYERHKLIG